MIDDYFSHAFKSLKHRKTRTWLTMIGIVIGIAAVVSIISLGEGLKNVVVGQFEDMGADKIMVIPGSSMFGPGAGTSVIPLDQKDLNAVKRTKGIAAVTGMLYKSVRVEFKDESDYTFVMGLPLDPDSRRIFNSMQSFKIDHGTDFKPDDRNVIAVGSSVALDNHIFSKGADVGNKITINGVDYKIIAVLKSVGNEQDDRNIYLPLATAREVFEKPDEYDMLFAQSKPGFDVGEVADDVKEALRKSRDLKEGEEDFTVQTTQQLQESFNSIFSIVQWFLIGIAAISIVVGGIGIMNTMYTSVLERTYDIGIMKAVGAKNDDILLLFMIESGTLGAIGGLMGVIIGGALAKGIEIIAAQALAQELLKAHLGIELIAGAVMFSFIVGMASGALPAKQAASLKPVDALRWE